MSISVNNETRFTPEDTRWSGTFHDKNRGHGGRPTFQVLLSPSGVLLELHGQDAKAAAEPTVSKTEMATGMGVNERQLTSSVRNVMGLASYVGVGIRENRAAGVYEVFSLASSDVQQGVRHSGAQLRDRSIGYSPDPRHYSGVKKGVNRTRVITRGPQGCVQQNVRKW